MTNLFFEQPILNSPYDYRSRHRKPDEAGQPTQRIIESRRKASFAMAVPKARSRYNAATQDEPALDEGAGLSTSTATSPALSKNPNPAASPSKLSTTSATRS